METMVDQPPRQSTALPSIGHLGSPKSKREDDISRRSTAALPSPSSLYAFGSGNPTHQGQNGSTPGIITPPGSRRTSGEEAFRPTLAEAKIAVVPPPPRQSLPSIHEALRSEPVMSYSGPPSAHSALPTSTSSYFPHPSPTASSEDSRRDPATSSFPPVPPPPSQRASPPQQALSDARSNSLPGPSYHSQASRVPPLKMLRTSPPPPPPQSRSALPYPPPQQVPRPYEQSPQSAPANPSYGYPGHQSSSSYPYASSSESSYPPPPAVMSAPPHNTTWPGSNMPGRKIEPKAFNHSIKRKLDDFALDSTLYELASFGGQIWETAGDCAKRVAACKANGEPISKAMTLTDMERLSDQITATQRSYALLQEVMQQSHAEQIEQQKEYSRQFPHGRPESYSQYGPNHHGDTLPPVSDPNKRKRNGRAAPPGRCHSCNRAETPEWRRGPDGARTLCNACGLHYAKLTRKMGSGAKMPLANSPLRPK